MATAQDLINSAAKLAGVLAEGQTLEGGINADILTRLNRMIARFRNAGFDLGVGVLLASDTLHIDSADEDAIELGLMLRIAARFRRPIDPGLKAAADSAITELKAKYAIINEMTLDRALTRKYLPRKNEFDSGEF